MNEAPTSIELSNDAVDENSAVGTLVGNITVSDPDNEGKYATTQKVSCHMITDTAGAFEIKNDAQLVVKKASLNFEEKARWDFFPSKPSVHSQSRSQQARWEPRMKYNQHSGRRITRVPCLLSDLTYIALINRHSNYFHITLKTLPYLGPRHEKFGATYTVEKDILHRGVWVPASCHPFEDQSIADFVLLFPRILVYFIMASQENGIEFQKWIDIRGLQVVPNNLFDILLNIENND